MQFDIFEASQDTGLRNDVLNALEAFDASAAQAALAQLAKNFAQDASLPDLQRLIDVLPLQQDVPFASHAELALARQRLQQAEASSTRMFGRQAGCKWLAHLWRVLAQRAARLPFASDQGDNHGAALYLRAGDWQSASDAVAGIASWRRIPQPLGWMAEAQYQLNGREAAWPLLCGLAWMVPKHADTLLRRLADPVLNGLLKKFHATFEGTGDVTDLAWFPAWVLTQEAKLADWLRDMQPVRDSAAERAALILLELLGLERCGQHQALLERRKRLQGLQPSLYAAYMKTR